MSVRSRLVHHPAAEVLSRTRRLARGALHPLHRGEALTPFFVVGSGRSGTTLLRRLLQASPHLHVPPELHALGECIRVYRRNRTLPWPELVRATLGVLAFDPTFAAFGVALPELAEHLDRLPPERRSLAALVDGLYRTHARLHGRGAARWGDKTPLNAFALDALLATFPRARFVHLLRDGVDVCHSFVRAGLQPDLAAAARRWRDSVLAVRAFAARHPERCRELRYEVLARAPERSLAALCSFLETPFDPRWLATGAPDESLADLAPLPHMQRALAPVGPARIGLGRRALSPGERRVLQRLIGRELAALGYPPAA